MYSSVVRERIYATDCRQTPQLVKIQGRNWPNMFFWIFKNEEHS